MRVLFSSGISLISKPRCGSTSVRRMLDKVFDENSGDIRVDVAGTHPIFHPHITGPYLKSVLSAPEYDNPDMLYFTVTRHPLEMLWSYFKYFQPDHKSRYNFSPHWDQSHLMDFERWVCEGRLGAHPNWLLHAPKWISTEDLSVLALEFYACDRSGAFMLDRAFRLEEPETYQSWVSDITGQDLNLGHVNHSRASELPPVGREVADKLRRTFKIEAAFYGI